MTEQEKKQNEESQKTLSIPEELPILPLSNVVVFPMTMAPLIVGSEKYVKMIEEITAKQKLIALVTQKKQDKKNPQVGDLNSVGTAGMILQMLKNPDNTMKILVRGIKRIHVDEYTQKSPYFIAKVTELDNILVKSDELEALVRTIRELFAKMVSMMPQFPDELKSVFSNITDPGEIADFVATTTNIELSQRQAILEELDVARRLKMLQGHLNREIKILEISTKIKTDVNTDIDKSQRDFYLRKQLDAIKKELGEDESGTAKEAAELSEKLKESRMNDEARKEAERELDRLRMMHPSSAEYSVVRTYLDWMLSLPWQKETEDNLDLQKATEILDRDHYDLEKPKERILEYLGVRKLKPDIKGPILCFTGPPGVGKTSLGRSIASALGRKFIRLSLGGVRDEAEIRGHRRTYVGALPGRIIQGIRRADSLNPVFMLDEVDKLGADFRGDPSSALLEVLDPEQNNTFSDHYLDVPFDLSKVMFITTANVRDTIPPALLDRMEVIELPGYMEEEKIGIARKYLIPKGITTHGLSGDAIEFEEEALISIIRDYTREAGLRNLERELATICRKVARRFAEGNTETVKVDKEKVRDFLGVIKFFSETKIRTEKAGVATGLAWTQAGGDILFIESTRMKGAARLILTGQLGDVMKESARAALSLVRSKAGKYNIPEGIFKDSEIHIHVPAGAIPKDGPSAGVAIVISLVSLLRNTPLASDVAATGEITLRGTILPVGGIREKVLAGRRAGIRRIILPKLNEKDLVDVPENLRSQLTFYLVEDVDEVLELDIFNKK
jgi:ATP-dependent Lon protease